MNEVQKAAIRAELGENPDYKDALQNVSDFDYILEQFLEAISPIQDALLLLEVIS